MCSVGKDQSENEVKIVGTWIKLLRFSKTSKDLCLSQVKYCVMSLLKVS